MSATIFCPHCSKQDTLEITSSHMFCHYATCTVCRGRVRIDVEIIDVVPE